MPDGFPMNRRAKGTKRRSYRTRPMSMVMLLKIDKEVGGIWKEWDRWRFIVRACWMVKLSRWEDEAKSEIPAAQIGNIRIMHFNSSTRCTVASLHKFGGFESVALLYVTAALSNHLQSYTHDSAKPFNEHLLE